MPEVREVPAEITDLVSTAFLVDIAGLDSSEKRDSAWEALSETPDFGDQIGQLRTALKDGYKREAQAGPTGMFFVMLKDRNLASLMKYLTIARTRPIDDRDATMMRENADAIVGEMGFKNIHDPDFRELGLNKAIGKLLEGSVDLNALSKDLQFVDHEQKSDVPPIEQWKVGTQDGKEFSPLTVLDQFQSFISTLAVEKNPSGRKRIGMEAQRVIAPLYNIVSKAADTAGLLEAEQKRLFEEWRLKNGDEDITGFSDYHLKKSYAWDPFFDDISSTTRDMHVEDAISKMTKIYNILRSVVEKR